MVGYTLTGNPVERALAILHGPGGTGKSRFVEMMNLMMGSYATTAAASLFESKKDSSGPSNDLNDLRGARLASVSELDHGVKMDEALVKRLTGLDRITSRGLYEENQTWMPACVIWLATNHLLKINPEDGAIWSRIKLITFDQEIKKLGKEDPFILDKLRAEADGIFNWMVEGLRKYQEVGLGAPESVKKAVQGYKEDQDAVIQFVAQGVEEGRIVKHQAQRLRATHSFTMYQEWCRDNHQLSLGRTRFYRRMESLGFARVKSEGYDFWVGLGSGNAGVLGTF
jgi:putative DNA primase/helicase